MNTMNYEYVVMLKRVPPGDRWDLDGQLYENLTDGLNALFLKTGNTTFLMNATEGTVAIQRETAEEPPAVTPVPIPLPKKYSLYDEN